jgi:anaerobic magnesium-protoporphyrin IX monomethyl ester cyclase
VFSINLKRAKELMLAIERAKLSLEFSVELHLKNLDDEFIEMAAKARFTTFKFGIESAVERVRSDSNRVSVDNDAQMNSIWRLRQQGIRSVGMFILAQPTDTLETCLETIDYASSIGLDIAQFSVFTPYPGTEFYSEIKDDIVVSNYESFDQYHLVYRHRVLTQDMTRRLLEFAYRKFLTSKYLTWNQQPKSKLRRFRGNH